jgi:hypothetical protein
LNDGVQQFFRTLQLHGVLPGRGWFHQLVRSDRKTR